MDKYQNTSVTNMYALGDVAGKKLLTPGEGVRVRYIYIYIYMCVCMKKGEDVRWWSVRGAVSVRLVECGAGGMWGW